ncbi:MAG TPA: glycosyltransferase [Candidatus Dormibacteraeota bacterium]|jgi:glycosyltransferase involved in cell wall biosynthesis|nr:glycosyltransferase [Candidatus Dormibacteraeota bacterium]
MRISVAMATFNGSRFIDEQLASILSQSRPADEIVICDDASADDTFIVARRLLTGSAVSSTVTVNAARLGPTRNFEQAIRAARGDVIVLADQDDVWEPHKLAVLEWEMARMSAPGAVFGDAVLIDDMGRRRGETLWQRVGMSQADRLQLARGHAVDVLLRHNVATGATMAFDARLRDLVLPFPAVGYHDAWIALLAAAAAQLVGLDEPVVRYRLHGANTAGLPARRLLDRIATRRRRERVHSEATAFFEAALLRLQERGRGDTGAARAVAAKVAHLRFRDDLSRRSARRVVPVVAHIARGDYRRYSREGLRSGIYDLLYG